MISNNIAETEKNDRKLERLLQKFAPQSKLCQAWPLTGGVSAEVTALTVEHPDGHTEKWVIRLHGERDRQGNPNIAADEFKLLQILQSAGVLAPRPLYHDPSGDIFRTPSIVIEYVEGETDFAPADLNGFLHQFTAHLAHIHRVDGAKPELAFLPRLEPIVTRQLAIQSHTLDASLHEGEIRQRIQQTWPFPNQNKPVLLHGDYWPGNILWQEGQLAAVIDWEDARIGDPLMDVANSRLELRWAFGSDAMHRFTRYYQSMTTCNFANLPLWDLYSALRQIPKIGTWGLNTDIEQTMRAGLESFVADALKGLSDSLT